MEDRASRRTVAAAIISVLFSSGLQISGFVNTTVAVTCWLLIIPIAVFAYFWNYVRRAFYWIVSQVKRYSGVFGIPFVFGMLLGMGIYFLFQDIPGSVGLGIIAYVFTQLSFVWWQRRVIQLESHKEAMSRIIDNLTDEKAALEQRYREMEEARDGQLRGRCGELSRELFHFHETEKNQRESNIMYHYNQRFSQRVALLRAELVDLGWWNPPDPLQRQQIHSVDKPDDILTLADYLNASCEHSFW